jgi:glycosyltransferase involved in cell wall biosynthesis
MQGRRDQSLATAKRVRVATLTTVHPRFDTRIFVKQVNTLASQLPVEMDYIVADGLADTRRFDNIAIHDLGRLTGGHVARAFKGPLRAFQLLRKLGPSIVHFHDPELIPLGLVLKGLGYKVMYDVHEDVPRQIQSKFWIPAPLRTPIAWVVSVTEWVAAKVFDAIIVATPKIAERFPAHKTTIVQNFPIAAELDLTGQRHPAVGPPCFAYVGGLARVRGCRESVEAMAILNQTHSARILFAGSFMPAAFRDQLIATPGWEYAESLGHLSRDGVRDTMRAAIAGLVTLHPEPNYIEAYPVKLFEYMAAGLPVIASDFPLWRSIVDGAKCGLLVDPLKPNAIAEAMRWILDNPVEAAAMGVRGRAAVETRYNWDSEATKLLATYERVLQR